MNLHREHMFSTCNKKIMSRFPVKKTAGNLLSPIYIGARLASAIDEKLTILKTTFITKTEHGGGSVENRHNI